MSSTGKVWKYGDDVNTDVIFPGKYTYTITEPAEMAAHALEDLDPEFAKGCAAGDVVLGGDNFGCGSSREHAAWALLDMGLTCVIAPSFSDIFSGNAFKNGILTVALPQEAVDRLLEVAATDPIDVDLETQTVTTSFQDRFAFDIDPFRKHCLLNGLDEVSLTLGRADAITAHERQIEDALPFLARAATA